MFSHHDINMEQLLQAVQSYVDAHYIGEAEQTDQYFAKCCFDAAEMCAPMAMGLPPMDDLFDLLNETDEGFSATLLQLIDRTGKKDAEIYKRANIDRRLFSKIRSTPDYQPSKSTVLAFAIALELNLEETDLLLERAGYALSHASKQDIVVEYFIQEGIYDIFTLNEVLFKFDLPLLGNVKR